MVQPMPHPEHNHYFVSEVQLPDGSRGETAYCQRCFSMLKDTGHADMVGALKYSTRRGRTLIHCQLCRVMVDQFRSLDGPNNYDQLSFDHPQGIPGVIGAHERMVQPHLRDLELATAELAVAERELAAVKERSDAARQKVFDLLKNNNTPLYESPRGQFILSKRLTARVKDEPAFVKYLQELEKKTGSSFTDYIPGRIAPSAGAMALLKSGHMGFAPEEAVEVQTTEYLQFKKS